ncbi:MAG: nicotinate phosphoribosyltransferase [Actinobacteria bacterium]|jgi:nicotinate phosphoribosyltransferase|nr:MAG: nicotinate phosphoribosyltransferase [Actinomycetota bacterium]
MDGPQGILDTDLYKLTMQQAVCQYYPRARARYSFINRGETPFPRGFAEELSRFVAAMKELRLTGEEKAWLAEKCRFFHPVYLDLLEAYRFDPAEVSMEQVEGELTISIEGYWYTSILWEVPLMALISELYFEMTGEKDKAYPEAKIHELNQEKARFFRENGIRFVDFGTRRRFSYRNHRLLIPDLMQAEEYLLGTSNVHLAHVYDLVPIGTQAHEWFQFHSAKYGFRVANQIALERWLEVYKGDLGVALTDTFGTESFFHAFDTYFAKVFDGIRQDSGDPFEFLESAIGHYENLGIDPASKTIVFSDSLNLELARSIHEACARRVKDIYGIGTFLTNDVGVKPLNMVIKMVECQPFKDSDRWVDAVKISDASGKYTGNLETIQLARHTLFLDD